MIKLIEIAKQVIDDKTILTSVPKTEDFNKFNEVTQNLLKVLKNSKTVKKEVLHNKGNNENMFATSPIVSIPVTHHLAEYNGNNFKNFTLQIAKLYEKAGFTVEKGYGSDDINGFEISKDGEVIGEVDFLLKNSIPNMNDTVIIKYKTE